MKFLSTINNFIIKTFIDQCTTDVYKKSDGTCACGFYLEKGLTWTQAKDRCFAQGARLPEIYNADDNDAILKLKVIELCYFKVYF